MAGTFENRMDEIQAQAEDYAKEVTRLQTQLDRSIEESKKIQTCPSEADVMRRKAGLMEVVQSLSALAAPVYLNVTSAVKISQKGIFVILNMSMTSYHNAVHALIVLKNRLHSFTYNLLFHLSCSHSRL